MDDRPLYIISVAAELANVHPQTLRIYERKGLLTPQRLRGHRRLYSNRDIEKLKRIQALTKVGVNLAGVKEIMRLMDVIAEAESKIKEAEIHLDMVKREAEQELLQILRRNSPQIVSVQRGHIILKRDI